MKCKIPPRPMSAEQEERYKKRCIRENDKIMHYADHLQCVSLRDNLGFGDKRLERYNRGAYELGRDYIERYTVEGEHGEEYAVTSYYALAMELGYIGWDPEERLWNDAVFASFPPEKNSAQMRRDHAERADYARRISFYVREMLCITAVWLHDEMGFAGVRLDRVLRPVADGYLALMREYMRCTREGDLAMMAMIDAAKKKYLEIGFPGR